MEKVIPTISSLVSSCLQTLTSPLPSSSSSSTPNPIPNQHQHLIPSPNHNHHHHNSLMSIPNPNQMHYTPISSFPESPPSSSSPSPSNPNPTSNTNPDQQHHYTLTDQQQEVLSSVAAGRSVFITGSAGTGKTFLLSIIIRLLRKIRDPSTVYVTASTGVAACSLSGQTLHSFSGVGLGSGDLPSLLSKISSSKNATQRWTSAKALIIDEISMIDGQLFDRLDCIARKMRPWGKDLPWGGIQLVVSGDFFQLPPINAPNLRKEFAFEADCWGSSFDLQVELGRVFRQSDSELIDVLQEIRWGVRDDNVCRLLSSSSLYSDESDAGITRLFPRNEDVRKLNEEKLRSLGREIVTYRAVDTGENPWKAQLKQGIAPEELGICEGARVMLIKNTDIGVGLVNGATGTVTGFVDGGTRKVGRKVRGGGWVLPRVRFDTGLESVVNPESWDVMEGEEVRATRRQIPLVLAWALSVHKCQGMTLDRLHTDLSRAFGCGMVYVALSRVRSLAGLRLTGFNPNKIRAHPKVLRFYEQLLSPKTLS